MKKKIILGVIVVFVLIIFVRAMIDKGREARLSGIETLPPAEQKEQAIESPEEQIKKFAVLSGIDRNPESSAYSELVVQEINVWEKAGSGGPNNMAIGKVPHDTKVEVLEIKEVEGNTFYKIRSFVGEVSALPTDFALRKKKMEELPESEWFVPADETFPVEGWVIEDFIEEKL